MREATRYIREQLTPGELFAQLAEEAGELAHAALKLRRIYDGKNPTPVSMDDAYTNLEEEIADVLVCLEVLGYELNELPKYRAMVNGKLDRWRSRLTAAEANKKPDPVADVTGVLADILRKYNITPKELEANDNEKGRVDVAAPRG